MKLFTRSKPPRIAFLLLCLMPFMTPIAAAQSGAVVTGKVIFRQNGKNDTPASNIIIRVYGQYQSRVTRTDLNGNFRVPLQSVGQWRITAFAKGYQQQQPCVVWVTDKKTTNACEPQPIILVPVSEQRNGK